MIKRAGAPRFLYPIKQNDVRELKNTTKAKPLNSPININV